MSLANVLRALVRKDIKLFMSDRRAVIVSFALPAVLATFMGLAMGGDSGKPTAAPHIDSLIIDQDGSPASQAMAQALHDDPILNAQASALEQARTALGEGKTEIVIVLPAGFGAKSIAAFDGKGDAPELPLLYDPSHTVALAIAQGEIGRVLAKTIATQAGDSGRELAARCVGVARPYIVRGEAVTAGTTEHNPSAHLLIGMGIQFILFGAIEAAVGILTDRQRGLWKRLQAAPLSRAMLLGSKILSGAIIAAAILAFLFAYGHMIMHVNIEGSVAGLVVIGAAFALMASTLGVLVSTLGKTPQVTRSFSIFILLIAMMLSGAWFPSALFPAWARKVTMIIPTRWAVDGLDAVVWRGLGFDAAILPTLVLLGTSLVFGALAVARFRWEE